MPPRNRKGRRGASNMRIPGSVPGSIMASRTRTANEERRRAMFASTSPVAPRKVSVVGKGWEDGDSRGAGRPGPAPASAVWRRERL